MKELKNILASYKILKAKQVPAALASVVYVEGSSYRRMGARMLVAENGEWTGGISGGCLEGDALKRAKLAILKSKASVIRYDTTTDDDHQIGIGLGCNGIIDVLFMPLDYTDPTNPLEVLAPIEEPFTDTLRFITVTNHKDVNLVGSTFRLTSSISFLSERYNKQVDKLSSSQKLVFQDGTSLFYEEIQPPIKVILFGHQYDIYPLSQLIDQLGWEVQVVAPPTKVRNSGVFDVIAPESLEVLNWTRNTVAVLMSHSLITDTQNLERLLKTPVSYIGMLGPRERSERIAKELKVDINDPRIFAPVGLDIGAETPDEIALSIVAEIKSFISGRKIDHLKNRKSPINERKLPKHFK